MKKSFLSIVFAALCAASFGQELTKIDFTYKKSFNIDKLYIDYNMDGKPSPDELLSPKEGCSAIFSFDYGDYGSAGNLLTVTLTIRSEEGDNRNIALLEDVYFARLKNEGETLYFVKDGLNDTVLWVSVREEETFLSIFNPSIFD